MVAVPMIPLSCLLLAVMIRVTLLRATFWEYGRGMTGNLILHVPLTGTELHWKKNKVSLLNMNNVML